MSETTYILTGERYGTIAVSPAELSDLGLSADDAVTPGELLERANHLPVPSWWLRNLIAELCTYEQEMIYVLLEDRW